jgi:hypothetical protein
MGIKQISVFLENNTGRIAEATGVLAAAGVNLRAISIADTADFGILRLIVDNEGRAIESLEGAGFTTRLTDVVAIELEDRPGSLSSVLSLFQGSAVNVEYLYASLEGKQNKAVVILKLQDHDKGLKILADKNISMTDSF